MRRGEARGGGRGLHADIAVEELCWIFVAVCLLHFRFSARCVGWDFGNDAFELRDKFFEVGFGRRGEGEPSGGERGEHGREEILVRAVEKSGQAREEVERREKARLGYKWSRMRRRGEELGVCYYRGLRERGECGLWRR